LACREVLSQFLTSRACNFALALLIAGAACAATLQVSPTGDFRTIQSAVNSAKSGDTILVHAGTYREAVRVTGDGLTIAGASGEDVILTGADLIPSAAWTQEPGKPIWRHAPWLYHGPTHPNDERHKLIGRTEQVIADGKLLRQVFQPGEMQPGTFCADVQAKVLLIWLADGGEPAQHRMEASVRPVLMEISGTHDSVRHLHLLYASNPAQKGALIIGGSDNLVEDCIAEWTNGVGAALHGDRNVARRVVSRFNGQMGMGGHGTDNRMEECTLEGNNVKGYSKMWEAGGIKITVSRNFQIIRCKALRNDGPGFWFDIDNRNERIEDSFAAENNGAGMFAEISETATFRNNVCVRNGLKDEPGAWNGAGILLGEAMRCIVEHNISVGNRSGIEVRQQRIRSLPADTSRDRPQEKRYYSEQHIFRNNIAAFNKEWQFAVYGDNAFFGAKREVSAEELQLMDPDQRGWHSENNLYFAAPGEGLILWGAKWLPKHQEFHDLASFQTKHQLENGSVVADPLFTDWKNDNFALQPDSPAKPIAAGLTR
jgi:hypothetical protein